MPKAVVCRELGPPESLRLETFDAMPLVPGQVRVAIRAAGLNFPDVLMAAGEYQFKPPLPFTPGMEAAGDVVEVNGAEGVAVGDRVIVKMRHGAYSDEAVGDAVLATANLLRPHSEPVLAAVRCGLAIVSAAGSLPGGWAVRVGIHFGAVVAGVVGREKFGFEIWGDTVNLAGRLSKLGEEPAVYLSEIARDRAGAHLDMVPLGTVAVKGKGDLPVFRCLGEATT